MTAHQQNLEHMIAYFEYLVGGEEGANFLTSNLDPKPIALLFNHAVKSTDGHYRLAAVLVWRELITAHMRLNKEEKYVN